MPADRCVAPATTVSADGAYGQVAPPGVPTPFCDRFADGSPGPAMVWLPGGTFRMGSPAGVGSDDERPGHKVSLDHYAVGTYPVTVGEFRRFCTATGYLTQAERKGGAWVWNQGRNAGQRTDANWRKPYMDQDDRHPVVCVSWHDAQAYCDWLSKETGQTYGLLTEAQWEFACRAGSDARYCFGDDPGHLRDYAWYREGAARYLFGDDQGQLRDYAWYDEGAARGTSPVGGKSANAWGLHDLHGNVWEWCRDWYAGDGYQRVAGAAAPTADPGSDAATGPRRGPDGGPPARGRAADAAASDGEPPVASNPTGPATGMLRVCRGGAWNDDADLCRCACRSVRRPSRRYDYLGFRLGRTGPVSSYPLGPDRTNENDMPRGEPIPGLRDGLRDGSAGPAMVWLPGGTFTMGQDGSHYDDEEPAHRVRLAAFAIGQYPITFAEYDHFCAVSGRARPDDRGWGRGERPVINVSWDDARAYCIWLGDQTGESYGLATEAQWEYACRAGTETRWSCGDDVRAVGDYAWFAKNAGGKTHPVGERRANAWHLHDLHGNVLEWCRDWYSGSYYQQLVASAAATADGQPPVTESPDGPPAASYRVCRGGAWDFDADHCRSASRSPGLPSFRFDLLGFRVVRTGPWSAYPMTLVRGEPARAPEPPTAASARRIAPFEVFRDPLAVRTPQDPPGVPEGPAMVCLPGGTFPMGDQQGRDNEQPVHLVRVPAFALGCTPVTWGQYRRFCEATASHWPEWLETGSEYHVTTGSNDYYAKHGIGYEARDLPVVGIAWEDARAYCDWLSVQTGERYALPTEVQWEYACRAGSATRWCCGDDAAELDDYAWFSENAGGRLQPVAQKQANAWGLYDLHGNVWEWCADWYAAHCYRELAGSAPRTGTAGDPASAGTHRGPAGGDAPPAAVSSSPRVSGWRRIANALRIGGGDAAVGPATRSGGRQVVNEHLSDTEPDPARVCRGGAWGEDAGHCRCAFRYDVNPSLRFDALGFRLARAVQPEVPAAHAT